MAKGIVPLSDVQSDEILAYIIDPEKCKGCSKCAKGCPVQAITGKVKSPFVINQDKCIKCGACVTACAFGAVREEA